MVFFDYLYYNLVRVLNFFLEAFSKSSDGAISLAVLTIALSLIWGLFGYKIFKIQISIISAFIFGIIAWTFMGMHTEEQYLIILISLLAALGGGFIGFYLYQIGIFIQGFFIGGTLSYLVFYQPKYDMEEFEIFIFVLILAVVSGMLFIAFKKFLIIFSTSTVNAFGIGISIQEIIVMNAKNDFRILSKIRTEMEWVLGLEFILLIGIPLAIFFIFFQYKTNKKPEPQMEENTNQNYAINPACSV